MGALALLFGYNNLRCRMSHGLARSPCATAGTRRPTRSSTRVSSTGSPPAVTPSSATCAGIACASSPAPPSAPKRGSRTSSPSGKPTPQRVVLVSFPHPGMRLPAIVTSTCRDVTTGKTLLCVYVPTTPVPTSGFFLIVPEEDTTELNWDIQQTLQAIISGGLTAPPEVTYYRAAMSAGEGRDVSGSHTYVQPTS